MNGHDICRKLQRALTDAREPYTPGVPMDAETDQKILCGLIDGLGGCIPSKIDPPGWAEGIRAGNELRKLLSA